MEVVVLGLLSALLWGSGDFGGGLLGRRAPVLGVVWVTLASGLVATIVLALVRAEPVPAGTDVAWSLAAGVAGIVGVTALYHGLAVGRMGVVAPTTGVLAAVVPVVVGFGLEGLPPATAVAGIVAAIVAVVLVTRSPGHADGRPSGAGWGLLAGAGIGLFNVFAGQLSPAGAFAPFVLMRVVQLLALTAFVRLRHQPWRMKRSVAVRVTLVGLLDMGGNVGYILAAQAGALAIAAVLSSLYPVVTVLLAIGVLHERVTPAHVVGIGFTVLAIVLIGVA